MLRRKVLLGTLTSALSAVVFTSTGWLMGTRTLNMFVYSRTPVEGSPPCCVNKCAMFEPFGTCVGGTCAPPWPVGQCVASCQEYYCSCSPPLGSYCGYFCVGPWGGPCQCEAACNP